jgi:hypothetical protein
LFAAPGLCEERNKDLTMTGSKIWKTDLQGLLEEAVAPVYVIALAEKIPAKFGDGELEMVQFSVSVTAFNEDGRALELRIPQLRVPAIFESEVEKGRRANSKVLEEVKSRLRSLNVTCRDGIVSDKPVCGSLE